MKNLFQAIKPLVVFVHLPLLIWTITKERVILLTCSVRKSILSIRLVFGYNKQTTFSKKTKFASFKMVNPNKVSKKKNIVHFKPKEKTCHYCMKRRHTSYKCYVGIFDVPRGKCVWIPKDLIMEINPHWTLPQLGTTSL